MPRMTKPTCMYGLLHVERRNPVQTEADTKEFDPVRRQADVLQRKRNFSRSSTIHLFRVAGQIGTNESKQVHVGTCTLESSPVDTRLAQTSGPKIPTIRNCSCKLRFADDREGRGGKEKKIYT